MHILEFFGTQTISTRVAVLAGEEIAISQNTFTSDAQFLMYTS